MNQKVQGAGPASGTAGKCKVHGKTPLRFAARLGVAIPHGGFMSSAMKIVVLLVLCLGLVAASGCATTKKLYNKMAPGSSGLKKRVLVLPFWDQAGLGEEKLEQLTEQFLSLLNRDGAFVIERGRRSSAAADRARAPEFGIVTDPEQARRAYQMGMNVMITAVFTPFETLRIKTGLWPFRKIKDETEIAMYVNAFDVINGTLLLTRLESVKIRTAADIFDEDEDELSEHQKIQPEIDEKTLAKSFSEIVDNQASEVSSAIRERPWYGRIISSDASGVFINAGRDVGVVPGSVFDVLGTGETITTMTGQTLAVPGSKVGELKVTDVLKDWALASIPEGVSLKEGQMIRFRK
jgi:hypothetical protein